jgi:hypothetical protein
MRQLDESTVPAGVYVEKMGKQSTEITRRSIDTLILLGLSPACPQPILQAKS